MGLFTFLFAFGKPALADGQKSIYDFKVTGLDSKPINFASFKGKKILIVNTASECGFTPQYKELQELAVKFKNELVIVGFPTNDFLAQEPGSNSEIKSFCEKNYGVTFPMSEKITVKGSGMAPIYAWLTQKKYNGKDDYSVKWNFQKFLIDEKGNLIEVFAPKVKPMSTEIVEAIKK
jgi:glutathione peroxidase